MGAQEDKLGKGSTVRAWGLDSFYGKENETQLRTVFFFTTE
jgi:hypothetical protein